MAKYCSTNCRRNAQAHQQIKTISSKSRKMNGIAHLVYRAYGYKCAICNWQATPELIKYKNKYCWSYGNEIHHITPVSEGGTEEASNLILLCPNHHKQADLGILDRDYLRQQTKDYILTEQDILEDMAECTEAIAKLING